MSAFSKKFVHLLKLENVFAKLPYFKLVLISFDVFGPNIIGYLFKQSFVCNYYYSKPCS